MRKAIWSQVRGRPGSLRTLVSRRSLITEAYSRGPTEPPLLNQTVGQHFASVVSTHGDRPAVISHHQRATLTYDTLDGQSNALARGLENLGVEKGSRVAVSLGNNIEFATVTYALFKLGAILVPLNPAFTASQIESALNHLEASFIIIGAENHLPRRDPASNIPTLEYLIPNLKGSKFESEKVPSLKAAIIVDNAYGRIGTEALRATTPYQSVLEDGGQGRSVSPRDLSPEEVVNIQFTSGTTSTPKAACLTHRSILNNGNSIGDRMLLTPEDVVCCPPPLFHCFGCILGYMATATHGSSIVFPSEAFSPLETLLAVQEYRCTALYGVPTMFLAELDLISSHASQFKPGAFSKLRTGIAAGSSIPAELMRKLHKTLNLTELTICYGMTETSPVSAMTTTDDPLDKRVNTVGRLLPHVTAKVIDKDDPKKVLGIGERGELVVSGYLIMKEYYNDKERTEEVRVVDEDGLVWMHTGDEAVMDEEGYVAITGRLKDIIIRGGENIHPLDIENCLLSHPELNEISCYGIPDDTYGEVVAVSVVRKQGVDSTLDEQGVRDWVRSKLARHFVPKYVFWTDSAGLHRTPSGKIQRFKLRADAIERLGLKNKI